MNVNDLLVVTISDKDREYGEGMVAWGDRLKYVGKVKWGRPWKGTECEKDDKVSVDFSRVWSLLRVASDLTKQMLFP